MEIISLKALPANCVLCDFFVLYCLYSTIALLSLPFLCMNKIIVGVVVVFFVTVFFLLFCRTF